MDTVKTTDVAAFREFGLKALADPTREHPLLPAVPHNARRILDVGCHTGHVLEALGLPEHYELFGCDINSEALALARKCLPRATFTFARAEELPYEDSYFDFVFARSAMLAFEIPRALREFNRVLKPGGTLWISLHRWRDVHFILRGTFRANPVKTTIFGLYVALNGALFHYTGKLVRYPLNRSRLMTFHNEVRMRRELQKAGFCGTRVSRTEFIVMESDKVGEMIQLNHRSEPQMSMNNEVR
jgi:SAM-dependent methyltransferase